MKYLFYCFITCSLVLMGCTKKTTDSTFGSSVDERLSTALSNYKTALTSAPGWKLYVYPKGAAAQRSINVGGLTYYLKFDAAGRVKMVSDFLPSIATTPQESGYSLKALQRPSLIFDTYNYMQIPADPDPNVSLSPTGTGGDGWGTDFNFSFTDVAIKDTMNLIGNFNQSAAVLVKATQAEMDAAYVNSRLLNIMNFSHNYPAANPFLYLGASSSLKIGIGFDFNYGFVNFTYLDASSNIISKSVPSSFTTYGIHLGQPVTYGSYTFQDLYWDDATSKYYILSGTTKVFLINSPTPIIASPITNIIGGATYTTIQVPTGATLPGEGVLFLTSYNAASAGMLAGPYKLSMKEMSFVFNAAVKTMNVNVTAYQGTAGPFLLTYNYSYTVDASGNFKFTKTGQNGNAGLVVANMNNILTFIESDQFAVTAIGTSSSLLGGLTSKQNPTFAISGNLF